MSAQTYQGGCQCGAVRYRVNLDLGHTVTCNCSRCRRVGSILAFAPRSEFELLSGEGATTEFQFNKHVIHHLFCSTCGIQSFSLGQGPDGTKMAAINVRCLDDVDIEALSPQPYDGKSA